MRIAAANNSHFTRRFRSTNIFGPLLSRQWAFTSLIRSCQHARHRPAVNRSPAQNRQSLLIAPEPARAPNSQHPYREQLPMPRGVRMHPGSPHKPIGEAIGLALDRRIEYLDGVRIVLVSQHGAFRVQHKACRFHLLANSRWLDPMQRRGMTCACPTGATSAIEGL